MEKSPGHFWEIFWSSTSNKLPSVTTSTLRGLTPSCCNQRDPAATLVFARMQPSPCTGTRGRWDEGRGGWRQTTNTFTFFYSSLCIRQRFVGCKPHSPYNTSIFWLGLLSQSLSIAFPYRNTLCMCFASWVKIDRYNSSAALTGRLRKKNAIILLVYLKNMQEIALLTSACLLIGYLLPEKKDAMGLSIFIFLNLMSPRVNLKVIAKHFKALPYLHSACLPAHAHTSSPNTESKSSLNINLSSRKRKRIGFLEISWLSLSRCLTSTFQVCSNT